MPGKRPQPAALAATDWDLVVIGGGITGAGILLEAAARGLRVLLVEQRDFAWGTSSRSSKMVHGGLRYIAQGDIRLTRDALRERERLIRELPGLVARQTYLFPVRSGQFPGRWPMKLVLWFYDRLAGIHDHRWLPRKALLDRLPGLDRRGLKGAMSYTDALTDDARLVLRVLREGVARGGRACNYLRAEEIRREDGRFQVRVRDETDNGHHVLSAARVINATGAWADRLSGAAARIRPLRGSHLFLPRERLPVDDCLTIMHPEDGRPVFIFPWEGATCVGTTDLDHGDGLDTEPRCSPEELRYLLALVNSQFPRLRLSAVDVLSTQAGVRPVISSGRGLDPSKERRDHAVWEKDGVISVSGGKLTTFRLIALDALHAAGLLTGEARDKAARSRAPLFGPTDRPVDAGHPGRPWPPLAQARDTIARMLDEEMVVHLDDLMLRRTRLGNLRPRGGEEELDLLRPLCQQHLGWDDARWKEEKARYRGIIEQYYAVPGEHP